MSSNKGTDGDQYEEYNYDQDKFSGHGGKGRSKKESAQHHSKDPSQKASTAVAKGEEKRKKEALEKQKSS